MTEPTDVAAIAAMAQHGEWLNADACAFLLGLLTPAGKVNRRAFLERYACRPSFPRPWVDGGTRKWRRAEVLAWADDEAWIAA